MNRIERVVVDECVGQESPLVGQLCERLRERPVKFVFLATEHPGIPDIEILDKLLDGRSALLTQDRVLHNLAIGRGFQSFVHTPESGLTDRRLVHVSASDKHLPVASSALRDSYRRQQRSSMPVQLPVRASTEAVSHEAPPYPCPFRLSRQYSGRCAYHRASHDQESWRLAAGPRIDVSRGPFNFWKTTLYKVVFGCASCAPRQGEIGFAFQS